MTREQDGKFKKGNRQNNAGEPEVVSGKLLSDELKSWEVQYKKTRNHREEPHHVYDREKGRPVGVPTVMGPVEWLAWETGIHNRRVTGIKNGEFKYVPLSQAEKMLMAIDREYLLGWHIPVIPNPTWTSESWAEYMAERGCV